MDRYWELRYQGTHRQDVIKHPTVSNLIDTINALNNETDQTIVLFGTNFVRIVVAGGLNDLVMVFCVPTQTAYNPHVKEYGCILLDPTALDNTDEVPFIINNTLTPVERERCVSKELAVKAAIHFYRTALPSPDLMWRCG